MATQSLSNFRYNSNAQYLFSRTYSLALGAPGQTSAIQLSNLAYNSNGKTQPSAPFRISFDIDKNLFGSSPNKSKIEIWNLATQNRSKIKAGFLVQLQAGYRGLMDTIFLGNIASTGFKVERHGPDVVMSFECGEGESVIVMARFDKSYPAGTTLSQIISDVAAAMAVNSVVTDQGVGNGGLQGIPNFTYGRGLTVHGPCRETLDKLLKNFGLRWTIQNGNLVILPVAGTTNGERAILVSSGIMVDPASGISSFNPARATGLIGVPSVGQNFIAFKTLLNPNIKPGALAQLQCEDVSLNGFYKINRAKYVGDTHDAGKWHIECETTVAQPSQGNVL